MTTNPIQSASWLPAIKVITFDCYGTLIDWESGIWHTLSVWLKSHGLEKSKEEILDLYAAFEPEEQGSYFVTYREVLCGVMKRYADHYHIPLNTQEANLLVESLTRWEPFPETNPSLTRLESKFKLAIISNIDNDLFEFTRQKIHASFVDVITAGDVRSYKPSHRNFRTALERLDCRREHVLHVAESLFHDIQPCNELEIRSVWVNRRSKSMEAGATRSCQAIPDNMVTSLTELADLVC
jgi:2-haloacid dehalogenase